jgi:hypothetical protein
MKEIIQQRMTADLQDEVVVFLIGMRINKLWKIHKWLPVALAMPKMIRELAQNPAAGLLSFESWFGNPTIMVQYWRSFEDLECYARSKDQEHYPAWKDFNQKAAKNGDVGIWHETYLIHPGDHESVYNNMPPFGLGKVTGIVPAVGKRNTAASRLKSAQTA